MTARKATVKFTVTVDLADASSEAIDAVQDALDGAVEFEYGDEWLGFDEILADWLPDILPEGVTVLTASVKVDKGGIKLPKIELPDIGLGGGASESLAPSASITQSNVTSSVAERPSAYGTAPKSSARPRTGRTQPRRRLVVRRRAGK